MEGRKKVDEDLGRHAVKAGKLAKIGRRQVNSVLLSKVESAHHQLDKIANLS